MPAYSCLRWFVLILNFFFWLLGVVILIIALYLRFDSRATDFVQVNTGLLDEYFVFVYILLLIGLILTLLGFLGCCGAFRESQCMLVSFFVILLIVFIIEFVVAILVWYFRNDLGVKVEESVRTVIMRSYGTEDAEDLTTTVDRMQSNFECCGVKHPHDWLDSVYATGSSGPLPELGIGAATTGRLPPSCCTEEGEKELGISCGLDYSIANRDKNEHRYYQKGCAIRLYDYLYEKCGTIITITVFAAVVQCAGMILSMLLCCCISNRNKKTSSSY